MAVNDAKGRRLGEILAALGVIGSLMFVAIEIRQNTEAVRGATTQAVSQQSMDLIFAGLENPDIREAFAASARQEPLTPYQARLLTWFIQGKLRADENRFRQVELGLLEESTFSELGNNGVYRLPFFAEFWDLRRSEFAEDFRQVVEREFLPLSGTQIPFLRLPSDGS